MRALFAVIALLGFSISPVLAADDGGFGKMRFSGSAPVALADEKSGGAFDPASVEPAAGDDETAVPTETSPSEKEPIDCLTDKDCQAGWICDVQSVPCETDPQASECVRKACMPDTTPAQNEQVQ
jgi:hypothetical protein